MWLRWNGLSWAAVSCICNEQGLFGGSAVVIALEHALLPSTVVGSKLYNPRRPTRPTRPLTTAMPSSAADVMATGRTYRLAAAAATAEGQPGRARELRELLSSWQLLHSGSSTEEEGGEG